MIGWSKGSLLRRRIVPLLLGCRRIGRTVNVSIFLSMFFSSSLILPFLNLSKTWNNISDFKMELYFGSVKLNRNEWSWPKFLLVNRKTSITQNYVSLINTRRRIQCAVSYYLYSKRCVHVAGKYLTPSGN